MSAGPAPVYYCWSCYARNDRQAGPCERCGRDISPPTDISEVDRLLWGIGHPDPDVAIISTRRVARLGDQSAIPALRKCIEEGPDPYVAVEALRSLLALSSATAEEPLLRRLARAGPILLRSEALQALDDRR